ncbi:MAG: hypothetical protein U5K56_17470 [Halioglobus sp.]|nr:hypothetical protein [Halioglobus sp.]
MAREFLRYTPGRQRRRNVLWKRMLIGLLAVLIGTGALAYLNRKAIVFQMVQLAAKTDVAENRPIEWSPGTGHRGRGQVKRPAQYRFHSGG